jgi:putative colanic acid biosynthesis glycosyltransferase WcaI
MYAGNHSLCHPPETLLQIARSVTDDDRIRFVFVGGESDFGKVRAFADYHRLNNVVSVSFQPRDQLASV